MEKVDLFGNIVQKSEVLRDKFIEPPFSVLDAKQGAWQARKRKWKSLGIRSETGRGSVSIVGGTDIYRDISKKENYDNKDNYVSIFDPALTELLYHWFCPDGGKILDPFAGGSVRGIVANYLGYKYTGIELRKRQVESNRDQSIDILDSDNQPKWIVGDSNIELDSIDDSFDFVFSCPPYANLEVYSDLDGDISNMNYSDFLIAYKSIIKKSCSKLKKGGYACFVVGEVRDSEGNFYGFVPDTVKAFQEAGMNYYNEAILLNPVASASMRANGNMKSKKLAKIHQNVLIFIK